MKDKIDRAKEFVKHKQVIQITDRLFEVEKHQVIIQTKSGRQILLCDCENSSKFGHNQLCVHKLAVILSISDNEFYKKIDKLLEDYQRIKDFKLKIDTDIVLSDLESLRKMK